MAQAGHETDDTIRENEAGFPNGLELLMDISSSIGDISNQLEATERYIQAREQLEGGGATTTP